jgi:ribosome-binding protein aMBF1 (putative translation factor)
MTTPELLREIGQAMFGDRWQTDLAHHLDVNDRTVRRWLSGQDEPRPGVWDDLERLLDERIVAQERVRAVLRRQRRDQTGE